MPGITEIAIIGGVIFLLFGSSKLPALGSAVGESVRNFKKGLKDGARDVVGNDPQ